MIHNSFKLRLKAGVASQAESTCLAHGEPWVQSPAFWAKQDDRKPCCTDEERSKEADHVVSVFIQCYNCNFAKWLVHQAKQLKWSIFNKQFTSYGNIYNESILHKWASHTVCLFFQTSKGLCFPQHPWEINKHYITPNFLSVVNWWSDTVTKHLSIQCAFTMTKTCCAFPYLTML